MTHKQRIDLEEQLKILNDAYSKATTQAEKTLLLAWLRIRIQTWTLSGDIRCNFYKMPQL